MLEYFSSTVTGQVYDRAAAVTRCLETVFKYADLLWQINQHSFAKTANSAEDKQEAQALGNLDDVCRYVGSTQDILTVMFACCIFGSFSLACVAILKGVTNP